MGLSSVTNRVAYQGNGSSTVFAFPYYFFSPADLQVYLFDVNSSVVYPQTLNTNYTISGAVNQQGVYPSGGNVVMGSSFPSNLDLVIVRSPALSQTFALAQNGPINSLALVQQLDYLTALTQRMQDQISRCLILPDGLGPINGSSFSTQLPSNISLPAVAAYAPLVMNSGATGVMLGTVIGSSGFSGTMPVINGGTGQNLPLTQYGVWYSINATQMGNTGAGSANQYLQANPGAAPSFGPITIGSASISIGSGSVSSQQVYGILPVGNGGTGLPGVGGVNQLFGTNLAGTGFESKNVLVTASGSMTIQSGQVFAVPNGTAGAPSLTFANDLATGWFYSASSATFVSKGNTAVNILQISPTIMNFGFGTTASGSISAPVQFSTSYNGTANFFYQNASASTSSATVLSVQNGTSSNYTTIENWANTTAGYLAQGSAIFSSPNQTQMVIGVEAVASSAFLAFTVGGRSLAAERMRLNEFGLLIENGGFLAINGTTAGTFSQYANANTTSYSIKWPAAQGSAGTVPSNDGSGNLAWNLPSQTSLSVVSTSAAILAATTNDFIVANSGCGSVTLYGTGSNSGKLLGVIIGSTNSLVSIVGSGGATIDGVASIPMRANAVRRMIVNDAGNWTSLDDLGPCTLYAGLTAALITSSAIKYDTIVFDTYSGYATATGLYTCPLNGYYRVSVFSVDTAGTGLFLARNGAPFCAIANANALTAAGGGSAIIACSSGHTLNIQPPAGSQFDFSGVTGSSYQNYMAIDRLK